MIKQLLTTVKIITALLLLQLLGCAQQPLLPVNLENSDWQVLRGQALWKPAGDQPAIAGDLLIARHENGDCYIEFTKTPVVIFTAQTQAKRWSLSLIAQGKSHQGRGEPPQRFIWFSIPDYLISDKTLPQLWQVKQRAEDMLILQHTKTAENIRLVMDTPLP